VASIQRLKDWALLIVCNLIWASQPVMIKLVLGEESENMGPVFATFFPIAIAMFILMPIVARERRANRTVVRAPMPWRDMVDFALIGVFGQIAAQFLITWGTELSPASNVALLFLTLPISTYVMAHFFLGERMTRLRLVAFVLAVLGVFASSGVDVAQLDFTKKSCFWGSLLVFLSINGSAFYNVYSKKLLTRYTPLEVLLYSYGVLFVVMLPVTLYYEPSGFVKLLYFGPAVWGGLTVLALFQYALSMVIFLHVLARLDATQTGLMNYLIPFLGVVIAWAVLGETLTFLMVVGGVLALGSTLLATVFDTAETAEPIAIGPE
jgi:drug/metabolite transporter (DMT)-like permease